MSVVRKIFRTKILVLEEMNKEENGLGIIIPLSNIPLSHHQLQDALRMIYPLHHWGWIHPFQMFHHIMSSSVARPGVGVGVVDIKILGVSGFVTSTVITTKIKEI